MDIYECIDRILNERQISRRHLAQMANIPPTTLQSALSRKQNLTFENLQKIVKALDIDLSYLLFGKSAAELDAEIIARKQEQSDDVTVKLIDLFASLDEEGKKHILSYGQYMLEQQNKSQ